VAALMACVAAPLAHVGISATVFIFGPSPVQNLTSTGVGSPSGVQTVTLILNPNGQTTVFPGRLQTLGFSGANAADFAVVPGGTCAPGTTTLSPITTTTGQSCTVNVRYTPSATGSESAFLTASCLPVALVGGFSVNCSGVVGSVASFVGSLLAPVIAQQIPTLSTSMLTVLALSIFVFGAVFSLRRR
jgi:hypothetical protein